MAMQDPPHPGESVRLVCLEPLEMSVTDAAKALGVSRKHLSDLVNCRTGVSAEMAIRLSKVFGGNPRVWYMAQAAYDLAQALKRADDLQLEAVSQAEFDESMATV